jgi:hypothetical protein
MSVLAVPDAPACPARALPRARGLFLLLALCGLLFFYRLADRELHSSHEARAAQNAQTILDTGDWGLPRLFDRRAELQKPPLYYWLVAALARLAGGRVEAWAVRLPAALSALGTVLLVYVFAAARGRPRAGLVAAAALATGLHFTWMARVGRIDMPLTFTVSLALAGFSLGRVRQHEGKGGWRWFLLSYLAVGVGLLLKGPIAAVLPGVAVGLSLLVEQLAGIRGPALAGGPRARPVVGPPSHAGRGAAVVSVGERPHGRRTIPRLLLAPQLRPRLRRRGRPGRTPLVVLRPAPASGPAPLEPAAAGRGLGPVAARLA